jgi:exoribonuclease-2
MATSHGTGRRKLQIIAHDAMLQRGLLPDFSPAVIAETNRITGAAKASGPAVHDLRGLLWASIDNDDSEDLDQLSVAEPAPGGAVKILVAIADVDALVKKDSAIDGHARTNTTSVYTAAEIFPMLPVRLSTDLTSVPSGFGGSKPSAPTSAAGDLTPGDVANVETRSTSIRRAANEVL